MKKLVSLFLCLLLLPGCAETYDGPTKEISVCSRKEIAYYGSDGSAYWNHREEYAYDIYGNLAINQQFTQDEPSLKTIYRYDEAGNVTRHIQYDVSGWLPKKTIDVRYTYDDQGRRTSTRHHAGGVSWDNDTIVYDDEAMTRTYTDGRGNVTIDYRNHQGWVTHTEQTFTDGRTVLTEYLRRSDGQPLSICSYEGGVMTSETVYTYDDQGRVLTQTNTEDGVSTLVFSWEYGENYKVRTNADGTAQTTIYHADGSIKRQYDTDADSRLTSETFYYYTTVLVPAGEEETP